MKTMSDPNVKIASGRLPFAAKLTPQAGTPPYVQNPEHARPHWLLNLSTRRVPLLSIPIDSVQKVVAQRIQIVAQDRLLQDRRLIVAFQEHRQLVILDFLPCSLAMDTMLSAKYWTAGMRFRCPPYASETCDA